MSVLVKLWVVLLILACASSVAHASPAPDYCQILRAFVEAVQPDETRAFTYRTSWGSNFKDDADSAFAAKRCEHDSYEPTKKVCAYLVEHGSTEFAEINVKGAISCLSKGTSFDPTLSLKNGEFRFSYGSEHRGAWIDIFFREDQEIGGMAFRLSAHGY